ncbi:MAG: hypothetical protein IPK00_11330 [Deltaproteobacteria bacterium]|nr:hypothetical protein [Deltaproteobacteria bacterium]
MPQTATRVPPDLSFEAILFAAEPDLRRKFLLIDSIPRAAMSPGDSPQRLLKKSACFLEAALVGAHIHRTLIDLGEDPDAPSEAAVREIADSVRTMYDIDLKLLILEARSELDLPNAISRDELTTDSVLSSLRSLLEICPIRKIEEIGSQSELEPLAHRCRIAFDGIKAFVLRHDPRQQSRVRVVGEAYTRGSISISESATLLGLHEVDAVATLEEMGFSRKLDAIALAEVDRQSIFSRMREDRNRRRGLPESDLEGVNREVVASERIEGIDARRWISREMQ